MKKNVWCAFCFLLDLLVKVGQSAATKAQVRQQQTRLAQGVVFHFLHRLRIVKSFDESAWQWSHVLSLTRYFCNNQQKNPAFANIY
jgi:hypothetical protein